MDENNRKERILPTSIEEEMKSSYIDYAMSVIMGRALPDVRDGLKPVQRRILYTMLELGLLHNKPFKKSATIVGNTMAKYHPHGDKAIYDALARMAQDFNMRYPLVDGQGNFGSIDGDSPAAMRYTEARLSRYGELMLEDIEKETVDFIANFDATSKEPVVLPSKIPNLLINGSTGIAVGMATSIPPHNLREVIGALTLLIDKPDAGIEEIMEYIKGPDYPNGGIILEAHSLKEIYSNGHGRIRARAHIVEEDNKLVVVDLPPITNKAQLVREIAEAVNNGRVDNVKDLRDESNREGIRIVIELTSNADKELVKNQLYRYTGLETAVNIKLLALDGKKPRVMSLKELLQRFIDHRKLVVERRTRFLLEKASKRLHIVEGLLIAIENIDNVIKLVKSSKNTKTAILRLVEELGITEEQAKAVVDMKISRLTAMEKEGLEKEAEKLRGEIEKLRHILSSEANILRVVKKELEEIARELGDERRTEISTEESNIELEEIIKEEEIVVIMTENNYLKAISLEEFKEQKRGGKGLIISKEDTPIETIITNNKDWLLLFSNYGKAYWLKAYTVPKTNRYGKGRHISNILKLGEGERIVSIIHTSMFEGFLVFLTKKGIGKMVELKEFSNPRSSGKKAINIDEKDELVDVTIVKEKPLILIATKKGRVILFRKEDLRPMGRNARGVILARLRDDEAISIDSVDREEYVLTITSKGYGKISRVNDYRTTSRGSLGVLNIPTGKDVGEVIKVQPLSLEDEIVVVTDRKAIRFKASDIRITSRTAKGVRVVKLEEDERVIDFGIISSNY